MTHHPYQALSRAIYSHPDVVVVESYSAFGQPLRTLASEADFTAYIEEQSRKPRGHAHIAIHYPDMRGSLTHQRVPLNPQKCDGHTFRHSAEGWGLIRVYLDLDPQQTSPLPSFVSANSEARALKWAPTYPEAEPPSTWDWTAVGRHLRRLKGALKKAAVLRGQSSAQ